MKANSSITNAYTVLRLLKENGRIKAGELADIIGVDERQIIRYISSLRAAGFDIKSSTGIHGGYHIEKCPFCGKELE